MLQLAMMFQDGMVLQRDKKAAVFGTADPNQLVTVQMQGITDSAYADREGRFLVQAGPFAVTFSDTMVIVAGESRITLSDVAVGEVWYAGGQSNMEFYMRYDKELEKEKTFPNGDIRFFDYPEVSYVGQLKDADYSDHYGFWRKADPGNLQWWSAVPYYFAKDLYAKYQIPIGIVGCNWGGTTVSCWMPEDVLRDAGGQFMLDEYKEQTKNLDIDAYNKAFSANPMSFRTDQLTGPWHKMKDWIMSGDYADDVMLKLGRILTSQGVDVSKLKDMDKSAIMSPMGPKNERRPCGLYYSMAKQVIPYTVRGMIWYQGESDGDNPAYAKIYHRTFSALIAHYRRLWKQPDLPVLFVQIAPYEKWMMNTGRGFGIVRKEQQWVADHIDHTAMAVITDNGMRWDIHPILKRPVGHRLALLAENKVYGDTNVLCEAPALSDYEVAEGRLTLTFANTGEGLHFTQEDPYGNPIPNGTFSGLEVFQNGRKVDLSGSISRADGRKVVVTSDAIHDGRRTEVRIADTVWYTVNLYNSADIPAKSISVPKA